MPTNSIKRRLATVDFNQSAEQKFREEFARIDTDGSARISKEEFSAQLDQSGLASSKRKGWIDKVFKQYAANPDEGLTLQEFMSFSKEHRDDLTNTFRKYDKEGYGLISQADLRLVLNTLKIPYTESGLNRLLHNRPNTDNPAVTFDQFQEIAFLLPEMTGREYFMHHMDLMHEPPPDTTPSMQLIAGGFSALFSRTLTAPADRLRAILAVGGADSLSGAVKVAMEAKGARGLWTGNGVNCLQVMPEHAITFWLFDVTKQQVCKDPVNPTMSEQFFSGAFAGGVAMTFVYPMYTMQNRVASAPAGKYSGLVDCWNKTWAEGGMKAMMGGYWVGAARVVPAQGINLAAYSTLKGFLKDPETGEISSANSMFAGAIAAGISQFVTYPLLLARTRLQTTPPGTYTGMMDVLKKAYAGVPGSKPGIPGLFPGLGVWLAKFMPAGALQFIAYEKTLHALAALRNRQ